MKAKTVFVCSECGFESSKWLGRCSACGEWNTMTEERVAAKPASESRAVSYSKNIPKKINDIEITNESRFSSGIGELDRVLGGGIVEGSLVLVGGDPGIGKSTILLQMCQTLPRDKTVLYASGEESQSQIKLRAQRLRVANDNLLILSETNLDSLLDYAQSKKPSVLIVDSVQTMYKPDLTSAPGSVSQVREVTMQLMRLAKELGIAVFIVGHVTKEGTIAGPKVLEHIVDCVLYFEGDRHHFHRILRSVKNRFGSTNEIGVFEMNENGLKEVANPSQMLLDGRPEDASGSCVICTIEGSRPMLAEVQALVAATSFNIPRRMATGIDQGRVAMLMAVLEKRVGMNLAVQDAYINIIGGIRVDEPAADLGIVLAIASGFRDKPVDKDCIAVGEVGLTGEIRAVSFIEKRINEAAKLGFKKIIVPKGNKGAVTQNSGIEIIYVGTVMDALYLL